MITRNTWRTIDQQEAFRQQAIVLQLNEHKEMQRQAIERQHTIERRSPSANLMTIALHALDRKVREPGDNQESKYTESLKSHDGGGLQIDPEYYMEAAGHEVDDDWIHDNEVNNGGEAVPTNNTFHCPHCHF